MKLNKKVVSAPIFTHEGGLAKKITPLLQLKRSVLATMLWEDGFYESGEEIAKRISGLVKEVKPFEVAKLAKEARSKGKLRHVPLLIARAMAPLSTHRPYVAEVLENIIQRPDELSEFLGIYWKDKKQPLSKQVKKGLARAFTKFDEYSLQKYNRDSAIKLRDVLFLCHAKPKDKAQAKLWKRLVNDELKTPDTWEVELSASKDKKGSWERLLEENKLGALALLRNLRNITGAGVDVKLIRKALKNMKVERVLPYRFITAARYVPSLESELEEAMFKAIDTKDKIDGETILLIDTSGSMREKVSGKSESSRLEAACGLAILARELFKHVRVFTFSTSLNEIPSRRGFALRDAIGRPSGGTNLGHSLTLLPKDYDRLIVFTDEQSHDKVGAPKKDATSYMINVASNQNGVGYGDWVHLDGFSEAILDYVVELEQLNDE